MKYWLVPLMMLCFAALVNPPEGEGCGPFLPTAQFDIEHQPGPEFARGQLGIVKPGYYRKNLIIAYRYLTGAPLTAEEIAAIAPSKMPAEPAPTPAPQFWGEAAVWLKARSRVPGAAPLQEIETVRTTMEGGLYRSYWNCQADAFETAAATLSQRTAKWGAASAELAEWLRGQDQLFSNCEGDPRPWMRKPQGAADAGQSRIPAELAASADPLLKADRQYQIAASHFYAGQFEDAEERFRAVAANSASPWRDYGEYLATRALIRQGTVDGDDAALATAEKALRRILDDPAQARWRDSARGLLEFVRAQTDPAGRLAELAGALSKPQAGPRFGRALADYTTIYDRVEPKTTRRPLEPSALTDWIGAFQTGDGLRALERWRSGHGAEWLIAALATAHSKDSAAVELTDAARKTPAGSPAYATAAFHGIRLEMEQGRNDEARAWAEQALAAKLPHGAANAIQAERRQLARNWSDFLRYASMQPVAAWSEGSYADGAFGQGSSSGGASWWTASERASSQPTFDRETTVILDTRAPLNLWLDALTSPLLPKGLQGEFAQAGWTRAVILNRAAAARQFAARTAELKPDLAEGMRAYLGAPSPEAAKFEAAYFMLKTPGLAPIIREGFGRLTVTGKLDDLRDNWWAIGERDLSPGMRLSFYDQPTRELFLSSGQAAKPGPEPSAGLLSETQRAEGRKEWEALTAAAGDAPAYLCAEALRWARAHPDDPRVPEALHLAVRATRYGQAYDSESGYSRRAFELLHLKYPKSKWAEMTKYWF